MSGVAVKVGSITSGSVVAVETAMVSTGKVLRGVGTVGVIVGVSVGAGVSVAVGVTTAKVSAAAVSISGGKVSVGVTVAVAVGVIYFCVSVA